MKKLLTLTVVLSIAIPLLLTGCSLTGEEKTTQQPVEETAGTKTGVIIEASSHVVSIQAPDGTTYTFFTNEDTKVEGEEKLGNTVSVSFDGEYTEGMVADEIKVIKEEKETETVSTPKQTDNAPDKVDNTIKYATGEVLNITDSNIKIKAHINGLTYNIVKNSDTKSDKGIVDGDIVRVFHKGSLKDGMVATQINTVATKIGDNTYTTVGTIKDASTNQITVEAADGYEYIFKKTDAVEVTENGLESVGAKVKITYTGDLLSGPTASKLSKP